MASEKTMKFIEDIKALSVLELAELVEAIQEEFGVFLSVMPEPQFDNDAGPSFNTMKYFFLQKSCLLLKKDAPSEG